MQSPSWEADWFASSQEIPRVSRNPNVHYRTHKRPPPASILGQPNPAHIPTSHLLETEYKKTCSQLMIFIAFPVNKIIILCSCCAPFVPPDLLHTHYI